LSLSRLHQYSQRHHPLPRSQPGLSRGGRWLQGPRPGQGPIVAGSAGGVADGKGDCFDSLVCCDWSHQAQPRPHPRPRHQPPLLHPLPRPHLHGILVYTPSSVPNITCSKRARISVSPGTTRLGIKLWERPTASDKTYSTEAARRNPGEGAQHGQGDSRLRRACR